MLTKIRALLPCLMLTAISVVGQSPEGTWKGDLSLPGNVKLPLVFHIQFVNNTPVVTMDSPAQNAKGIKADSASFLNNELSVFITSIRMGYKGTPAGDSIAGMFSQRGAVLPLVLYRITEAAAVAYKRPQEPRPPFDYDTAAISFKNIEQGNLLAGTLSTPKNTPDFPVVIMITGSGPQNRDEEIFGHKPFLVIADHFARHGIGSLRLDDRGVGGSEKGKEGATTADFATDINSAVEYLSAKGFKNIGLLGHSEGGMIAPMVADRNKKVKFVVLMAAPGIPIDALMILQNKAVAKTSGLSEEASGSNLEATRELYTFIKQYTGHTPEQDIKSKLEEVLKRSGRYTEEQQRQILLQQLPVLSAPWFIYFMKFNPADYLNRITVPVLAINGSKDVQVAAKENLEGIERSLEKAGNKNCKIMELPGLNHLFQEAATGAVAEYINIEQTIQPEVLAIISDWILKLRKK